MAAASAKLCGDNLPTSDGMESGRGDGPGLTTAAVWLLISMNSVLRIANDRVFAREPTEMKGRCN